MTPEQRRKAIAKIHIAKAELGLDESAYRSLLAQEAGVRSSKELNPRQISAVLAALQRLGWVPRPGKRNKGQPHNFGSPAMPEMITKIGALLADMQLPWSYADGIAKQMFGIQRCAWVRSPKQLKAIIAALHVEKEKRDLLAQIHELLGELGELEPDTRAALEQLPEGWERQRPILRRTLNMLQATVGVRSQA